MKMAILELEYKNIRKITALKLPFTKADGSVISNNFIMMANGTGKTTTMELIKGLFDGTAAGWTASKVRSFAPTLTEADTGEFSITVKFDDRQYKYFLSMNYKDGTVQVETSAPPKGREAGLRLPESIRGIFTPEFVRRFVFDGEQAAKSMDSSSNEADETIRYLYRLDELDEILAANQRILTEIQNAEGKRGTSSSLSNLRTRQSDIDAIRAKLRARCEKLREEIAAFEAEKVEKEKQRQELDKSYEKLNQEKNDILKEQQKNRGEIDVKITSILGIIKSPYLLSESLCARMFELGNSMKKLKLPKTIAKDFFTELASADRCVCDTEQRNFPHGVYHRAVHQQRHSAAPEGTVYGQHPAEQAGRWRGDRRADPGRQDRLHGCGRSVPCQPCRGERKGVHSGHAGGTRKPRDGADQHHGCCAGVPQTGKEKMTALRQFYRQSVVRGCPVRYNGATNRAAGSQGGQNDVRTEQDRFWEFSGTAAQGKRHDPEGDCRLPVCFG